MSRKQLALFEPTLVVQALKEAVKKLNPQAQWRNPVMFIVWIGSLLTTCIRIAMASAAYSLPEFDFTGSVESMRNCP